MQDLHNKKTELYFEIKRLADPHMKDGSAYHAIGFYWDCPKSPFGWCAYHDYDDSAHDNCVFCGEPEERK